MRMQQNRRPARWAINQRHYALQASLYASSAHTLGLEIVLRYDVQADAVSKRSIVQDAQQREHGVDNRRLIDRASEQRSIDRADLYIDPTDLAKIGLGGSDITPTKDKE